MLAAYKPSDLGDAVLHAAIEEARVRKESLLLVRHVRSDQAPIGSMIAAEADGVTSSPNAETGQAIAKLRDELEETARD